MRNDGCDRERAGLGKVRAALLLPLLATAVGCATAPPRGVAEQSLLGVWCARDASASYELFELADDHEFNSWLHERPSASGTWAVRGRELSIKATGPEAHFTIVGLSRENLALRTGTAAVESYARHDCVPFEPPPAD
jgi:hypothetical protein